MTKFKFKLQTLLNVKLKQEDNLKNELGKALFALEKEKAILRGLETEYEAGVRGLGECISKKLMLDEVKNYNLYLSAISFKMEVQKEIVNKAAQIADRIRVELVQTLKERQILEKFKERKYSGYLLEQAREELKLNDEITSYRYTEQKQAV